MYIKYKIGKIQDRNKQNIIKQYNTKEQPKVSIANENYVNLLNFAMHFSTLPLTSLTNEHRNSFCPLQLILIFIVAIFLSFKKEEKTSIPGLSTGIGCF